jgi:ribosomal protein S18 acetylase RimI-like enzyme
MTWTLRPAEPRDEDAVVALWRDCELVIPANDAGSDFRLARGRIGSEIFLAVEGDAILGSAMIGHDGHRGWIYYLATTPARRGQGIARSLIAHAEAWMIERRIPKLHLMVRSTNTGVIGLYETLGFAVHPVAMMQKVLLPVSAE